MLAECCGEIYNAKIQTERYVKKCQKVAGRLSDSPCFCLVHTFLCVPPPPYVYLDTVSRAKLRAGLDDIYRQMT